LFNVSKEIADFRFYALTNWAQDVDTEREVRGDGPVH
jgi:hypothetical protein